MNKPPVTYPDVNGILFRTEGPANAGGIAISLTSGEFLDPNGDTLTYTFVSDDPRYTISVFPTYALATFPQNPKPNIGDITTITVTANDGKGGIASGKWVIKIIE
ncbi:Ig-like domain-containing protein [Brevibacillus sp. NPDC058079]|uniref:Ig-like domain-containing protein n=1 Tax=Brevibacillus sp. NPDC058079 TaxID=3346330 RepID=UPI0036E0D5FB